MASGIQNAFTSPVFRQSEAHQGKRVSSIFRDFSGAGSCKDSGSKSVIFETVQ